MSKEVILETDKDRCDETLLLPPSVHQTVENPNEYPRLILTSLLGKGSRKDKLKPSPYDLSINHAIKIPHNQCQNFSTPHPRLWHFSPPESHL